MAEQNGNAPAEKIGFHKGSLTTLAKERQELLKVVGVVEQLMQMHIKALKELGIDIEEQAKQAKEVLQRPDGKSKGGAKLDDIM